MIPKKLKYYEGRSIKTARQRLVDEFQHGKVIRLKDSEFNGNKFRLVKSINFWNPFVTWIILGEIKGQLEENKISCEIGMSPLMKGVVYIDSVLLFCISLGLLLSSKFEASLASLLFLVILISFIYFRLKSEIGILTSYMDDTFND